MAYQDEFTLRGVDATAAGWAKWLWSGGKCLPGRGERGVGCRGAGVGTGFQGESGRGGSDFQSLPDQIAMCGSAVFRQVDATPTSGDLAYPLI
jgi:hypothetical protein